MAAGVNDMLSGLRRRVTEVLRASTAGDRRRSARLPLSIGFEAAFGDSRLTGRTLDLSVEGCLLHGVTVDCAPGTAGNLHLDGVGPVRACVRAVSDAGLHVGFEDVPAETEKALRRLLIRDEV